MNSDSAVDVSIITPIYRVEEDVAACLESVAQQNLNLELILVDDASDDASLPRALEAMDKLPSAWPRQVIRHEQNRGVSAARNSGTAAARGRYVFYLDGDDCLVPHCLECMLQRADEARADIVFGQFQTLGMTELHWLDATCPELMEGDDARDHFFQSRWPQSCCNKLVSRDFLVKHQISFPLGLKLHEDTLWTLATALAQPRVLKLELVSYIYRNNRAQSVTSSFVSCPSQELFAQREGVRGEYHRLAEQHQLYASAAFCRFIFNYEFQLFLDSLWRQKVSRWCHMQLTRAYLARLRRDVLRQNLNHPLKFSQIAAKICLYCPRILALPLMLLYTSEPSKRAYIKRNTLK